MKQESIFKKDFTLMVVGQIISLFGNNILRFALPLYLLTQTGSASLLGMVSALSFIPMVLLSPVGGIIADRVNKRNVMVVLDFLTAVVVMIFMILLGKVDLVVLMIITLMTLYGIQGSYQPAVQASVPALVSHDKILPASAVINQVNALAGLIGPVLGGVLFAAFGLKSILVVSMVCFVCSAIMELFITIPFQKQTVEEGILKMVKHDMKISMDYIGKEQPIMLKILCLIAGINLFLSSMVIVGYPFIITQSLGFSEKMGSQLLGYTQGILAAGGLAGGILAGVLAAKFSIKTVFPLLMGATIFLLPIGIVFLLGGTGWAGYLVMTICGFFIMALATIFSIQMLAFVQTTTPEHLLGKIMSFIMAGCMCAQPIGQALYGVLFDSVPLYFVVFFAAFASVGIALLSQKTFAELVVTLE